MHEALSSLSLPVRWILVLSHSADGDTEASGGDAVYPKTLKLGGSRVGPRIQVCTTSKPVFVTTGLCYISNAYYVSARPWSSGAMAFSTFSHGGWHGAFHVVGAQ